MKRLTYLIVLITALAWCSLSAQRGLNVGIKAGKISDRLLGSELKGAKISDKENFSTNYASGFSYGLVFRYGLTQKVELSTGIDRMYRKVRTTVSNTSSVMSLGEIVDGLEVPLKITYRHQISKRHQLTGSVFGGGSFTFWEPVNYKGGSYSPQDKKSTILNNYTVLQQNQNIIKGLVFGAGVEKDYGQYGSLYCGISYHHQKGSGMRHYSSYQIGNDYFRTENYTGSSYLSFDLVYYMPWRAFAGAKKGS